MAAPEKYLVIGRINGKSASRRQRAFKDDVHTVNAIRRWETEGFNGFWIFGPVVNGDRPLIGSWSRADDESIREEIINRLLGLVEDEEN